ncbi:MAG: epoxide hydrolase [OM182 bacterium MED-G28]|uniref:Epoxide hydrolase n=1 Tax=OM182 bacterium MED-G28 TaxID=1986256 RepID=A0A2A5WGR8_9GAMM|nr:MAG: epoxide hydrolase [OM182 bacterium MED-G28]
MNSQADSLANNSITPFQISISDEDLEDLQLRLSLTRLPDQLNNISWEYGTDLNYMRELIGYWQDGFDWREQERQLNQFDQFKTVINDLNMHFIHQRSSNPDAIPLMVVHGWPGSVSEFSKIIGPLTDPLAYGGDISDSFHVIAPSLPGFGFSGIPDETGYSPERIALLLAELMEKIGYERYAIAGGDWGAIINRHLANHYPDRLIGLHSNMMLAGPPSDTEQRANVTEEENEARTSRQDYMQNEVAYQQIQGTKPQTLGYGLNDSPAGVAAWIVEKFHGWTDMPQGADGYLDNHFTKDELLTNIAIYWFTNTITSSTRIYLENRNTPAIKPMEFINVPTGAAIFPAEIFITPRSWAEASYDLRHWTVMEEGGHFAALEQPELYLNDLREFFRLLR